MPDIKEAIKNYASCDLLINHIVVLSKVWLLNIQLLCVE
jgi:hypothetical protein